MGTILSVLLVRDPGCLTHMTSATLTVPCAGSLSVRTARHPHPLNAMQGLVGDDIDFENTWATIASAFTEIHTKNASKLSYEELYRHAYRVVLKKKGEIAEVSAPKGTIITPATSNGPASGSRSDRQSV